jgi:hypothetical protein
MEMYGVIENLQQTIQHLEAERSPSNPSRQPPPLLVQSSSADSLLQQSRSSSYNEIAGDRKFLLDLLDNAYKHVKYMFDNLDLLVEQRRTQIQSVLEILEQLGRKIRP